MRSPPKSSSSSSATRASPGALSTARYRRRASPRALAAASCSFSRSAATALSQNPAASSIVCEATRYASGSAGGGGRRLGSAQECGGRGTLQQRLHPELGLRQAQAGLLEVGPAQRALQTAAFALGGKGEHTGTFEIQVGRQQSHRRIEARGAAAYRSRQPVLSLLDPSVSCEQRGPRQAPVTALLWSLRSPRQRRAKSQDRVVSFGGTFARRVTLGDPPEHGQDYRRSLRIQRRDVRLLTRAETPDSDPCHDLERELVARANRVHNLPQRHERSTRFPLAGFRCAPARHTRRHLPPELESITGSTVAPRQRLRQRRRPLQVTRWLESYHAQQRRIQRGSPKIRGVAWGRPAERGAQRGGGDPSRPEAQQRRARQRPRPRVGS